MSDEQPWMLRSESGTETRTSTYPDENSARAAAQELVRLGHTDISLWMMVAVMLPRLIDIPSPPRG